MIPLVIRIMIISDATTWSITSERDSDSHNIFIKPATDEENVIFSVAAYNW
jgi:hypothetical protein